MLRSISAAVLVSASTFVHAQSPQEIERVCKRATELPEIVAIFISCEPEGRARYDAMPWQKKVSVLFGCLKSDKAPRNVSERQRVAIEYCFSELE